MTPVTTQTMIARPTELAFSSTPLGLTKIPEPMMLPETHIVWNDVIELYRTSISEQDYQLSDTSDLPGYYITTHKYFAAQKMENISDSILQEPISDHNHGSFCA